MQPKFKGINSGLHQNQCEPLKIPQPFEVDFEPKANTLLF